MFITNKLRKFAPMRKFDLEAISKSKAKDSMYGDIAILSKFRELRGKEPVAWLMDGIFIGYVTRGEANFMVDKHHYRLGQGDLFACHPRNILEKYEFSSDIEAKAIFISAAHAGIFADKISIDWTIRLMAMSHEVLHVKTDELLRLEDYMRLLSDKLNIDETMYKKDSVASLLTSLLYEMLDIRQRIHNNEDFETRKYSSSENIFLKFIHMLGDSSKPFQNVNEYAAELGITPKYFSTICREITGKTASTIINEEIIRAAKILLQDRTKSIRQVSEDLQFANQSHFASFFHRYAGISPQKYRKDLV